MSEKSYLFNGSAKVCTLKYGEPITVKVKVSIPKLPTWYEREDKR